MFRLVSIMIAQAVGFPNPDSIVPLQIRYKLSFVAVLLFSPCALWAQQVHGDCDAPIATRFLDYNNVRAAIYNNGALFWRGGQHNYTIPKNDGDRKDSIFAASIWIGGLVDGELRMSASDYGPWEFWPGPLDENGLALEDCSDYDRMYKVSLSDIESYNLGVEEPNPDLIEWPYHLGAPVTDGDGIDGNYDLEAGDRPEVLGHQNIWWIMNDRGNEHSWSLTDPLGLEVRVTAYAIQHPSHLDNTTFYQYELKNRGDKIIKESYFGVFTDPDLGNFNDDYVGSDSLRGLAYVWNGSDNDLGPGGYGDKPPALGITFVGGPLADSDSLDNNYDGLTDEPGENLQMTNYHYIARDGTIQGHPRTGLHAYRYMKSLWGDGSLVTNGGSGLGFSGTPTKFMFSGEPPDFWSEENADSLGTRNAPADRRFLTTLGPFEIAPGQTQKVTFAIIWAQGEDRFDSLRLLKEASSYVQAGYDAGAYEDLEFLGMADLNNPPLELPKSLTVAAPYPNPSGGELNLHYQLSTTAEVEILLFDIHGREVRSLLNEIGEAGDFRPTLKVRDLSPGLYFLRYNISGATKYFPISLLEMK